MKDPNYVRDFKLENIVDLMDKFFFWSIKSTIFSNLPGKSALDTDHWSILKFSYENLEIPLQGLSATGSKDGKLDLSVMENGGWKARLNR